MFLVIWFLCWNDACGSTDPFYICYYFALVDYPWKFPDLLVCIVENGGTGPEVPTVEYVQEIMWYKRGLIYPVLIKSLDHSVSMLVNSK